MSINDIEAVIPSMSHKILISFEIWLNNRLNTEIIHRKLFKHTITNEQTNKRVTAMTAATLAVAVVAAAVAVVTVTAHM